MSPVRPNNLADPRSEQRIAQHQDYVRALAYMIARRLPPCVEVDDLIQYGQIGLIRAARLFDEARGVAFRTFAYPYIRGAIIDGLRQMCRGLPPGAIATTRCAGTDAPLNDDALDPESLRSAAEPAGEPADSPRDALVHRVQRVAVACVLRLAHQLVDRRRPPDQIAELRELCDRIWRLTALLPARQRVLLRLHYVEGRSFSDCARLLGRDKSRISRWHRDALERLRTLLAADGRCAACA